MAREESVTTKELGIAVIGSGRIGTLRARLAAKHPAVRFVAVSDKDPANAKKLADLAGAHVHSADNDEIIAHPGRERGVRLDAGRRARRGGVQGARIGQGGAGGKAAGAVAQRCRGDHQYAQAHGRHLAGRL